MIRVEIPPEGDWVTLEKNDGKVCDTEHRADVHNRLDDKDVHSVVGDPEEEEANSDLQH